MWAKQSLHHSDIDYCVWERDRMMLQQMEKITGSCAFVVDVYKCRYSYASSNFADLLGYDRHKIDTVQKQGDYLESRIHPDDLAQLKSMQIYLSRYIYNLPPEERNNYKNIFTYRILNARHEYINVTGKHQVLKTSGNGKAWLILGITDISPNQNPINGIGCTVLNLKSEDIFSPDCLNESKPQLTCRETEILQLIKNGFLSKEIAHRLGISIHTVNIHRQNILRKLNVQNSIEAIKIGYKTGLIV